MIRKPTAIVMLNMGGPAKLKDVNGFLKNLFTDPDIIPLGKVQPVLGPIIAKRRTASIQNQYEAIGGGSPIGKWTKIQGKQMTDILDKIRPETAPHKAYTSFRYAAPMTEDALMEMKKDGVERAIAFSQYPQWSCTTGGSSMNHLWKESKRLDANFQWSVIDKWNTHDGYIAAMAKQVEIGLQKFKPKDRDKAIIMFSAHSVPMKVVNKGDPYVTQIAATSELVMQKLNISNPSTMAWQSKVGFLPWMGPSTSNVLKGLARQGHKHVLAVPIAFTSDHVETLYEIDIEYAEEAREVGIEQFYRAPALNDEPLLAKAMADIVATHLENKQLHSTTYPLNCAGCINPKCRLIMNPIKPYSRCRDAAAGHDTPQTAEKMTSVCYSTSVFLFKYNSSEKNYEQIDENPIGAVLMKSEKYQLVCYPKSKTPILQTDITLDFSCILQTSHYVNFFDSKRNNWSLKLKGENEASQLMSAIMAIKFALTVDQVGEGKVIREDLVLGNGKEVESGDAVGLHLQAWKNGYARNPLDIYKSNTIDATTEEVRKIVIGDYAYESKWRALHDALTGIKKSGTRVIILPPSCSQYKEWILIKVDVLRVKKQVQERKPSTASVASHDDLVNRMAHLSRAGSGLPDRPIQLTSVDTKDDVQAELRNTPKKKDEAFSRPRVSSFDLDALDLPKSRVSSPGSRYDNSQALQLYDEKKKLQEERQKLEAQRRELEAARLKSRNESYAPRSVPSSYSRKPEYSMTSSYRSNEVSSYNSYRRPQMQNDWQSSTSRQDVPRSQVQNEWQSSTSRQDVPRSQVQNEWQSNTVRQEIPNTVSTVLQEATMNLEIKNSFQEIQTHSGKVENMLAEMTNKMEAVLAEQKRLKDLEDTSSQRGSESTSSYDYMHPSSLLKSVERLVQENERYESDSADRRHHVGLLETKIEEILGKNHQLMLENNRLSNRNGSGSQRSGYESQLTYVQDENKRLLNEIDAMQRELDSKSLDKKGDLYDQLEVEQKNRRRAEEKLKWESTQRMELEDELHDIRSKLNAERESSLDSLAQKLQIAEDEYETQLEALRTELSQASQSTHQHDEDRLVEARSVAQTLQFEVKELKSKNLELQDTLSTANSSITSLKEKMQTMELSGENICIDEHQAALEKVEAQAKLDIEEIKKAVYEKARIEFDLSEKQIKEEHIMAMENEKAQNNAQLEKMAKELTELQSQIESSASSPSQVEELQNKISTLQQQVANHSQSSQNTVDLFKEIMNEVYFKLQDALDEEQEYVGREVISAIRKVLKKNTTEMIRKIESS